MITKTAHSRVLSFVILGIVLAFGAGLNLSAEPTAQEYATILNLSGKQRMLSQKITKEILLIAVGIDEKVNLQNLKISSELFDRTINGLKNGDESLQLPPTTSKEILDQLAKVEVIWTEFHSHVKEVLSSSMVTEEQIAFVSEMNMPLLKEMNQCVSLYELAAKQSGLNADPRLAVSINLAGKQRMLIQKMSKEFLFVSLGYDVEANKQGIAESSALFKQTLKGLVAGDENLGLSGTDSELIIGQLQTVESIWNTFEPIISKAKNPAEITHSDLEQMASINLPLLRFMNKVVGYFEKSKALNS